MLSLSKIDPTKDAKAENFKKLMKNYATNWQNEPIALIKPACLQSPFIDQNFPSRNGFLFDKNPTHVNYESSNYENIYSN